MRGCVGQSILVDWGAIFVEAYQFEMHSGKYWTKCQYRVGICILRTCKPVFLAVDPLRARQPRRPDRAAGFGWRIQ